MVSETVLFGAFGASSGLIYYLTNRDFFYKMDSNGKRIKFDFVKFNYVLAFLHLVAALVSYSFLRDAGTPEYLDFNMNRNKIVEGVNTTFDITVTPVGSPYTITQSVGLFYLITAFTHLTYASIWKTGYLEAIDQHHNPIRWLEYGVSATVMVYILCLVTGVKDLNAIIPIIGANICTMYCGYISEEAIRKYDFPTARNAITMGWILQISIYLSLFIRFGNIIFDIREIKDGMGNPKYKIPAWLWLVLIPTFLYYGGFGIVANFWYMNAKKSYETTGKLPSFEGTEKWYLYLSLFSKLFLGLYLGYGYTQQNDLSAITV